MRIANYFSIASRNGDADSCGFFWPHFAGSLRRTSTILLLVAAVCGSARAQYLGFAANSTDGTVSVFAVVTSGPTFGNEVSPGNQDHFIATVPVGKTPVRVAVTPGPNLNRAYVTNQGDNSLWVIDVTNVSQEAISPGSVTAQNVNPASNPLQLNQPGGIAIANITTGPNAGHVFAFVANQGTNTVSIIDTGNNTLFGTVTLGVAGSSTTFPEVAATQDGTQVFVTNNSTANCNPPSSTPCAGVWMINASSVTNGATATRLSGFGSFGLTTTTTTASLTSNVVTLTLSSNPGFTKGSTIQVSGFTGADSYFNGVFTITNVIVSTATQIQYNDTHTDGTASTSGTVTEGLLPATPRGVAALEANVSGSAHTILGISDATAQSANGSTNGHIFILDLTAGSSVAMPVPNGSAVSSPMEMSAFCVPSVSPCGATSILNAETLDSANNVTWLFSGSATALLAGNVSPLSLLNTANPTSVATTPDGQFSYVTTNQSAIQLIEDFTNPSGCPANCVTQFQFADGTSFGNRTSLILGNGPTGLAFSLLDPHSAPVAWFIPPISGGFAPPFAPLAVGSGISVSGESMVGVVGQPIQTTLNFGGATTCSIFDPSKGASGTTCAANATNGANGIGGSTASPPGFPNSGVFTVVITGTSNSSSGFAREQVFVGANCTWSPPSSVLLNVPVDANLSCTAPGKDTITGTVDWGDGTTEPKSVTALGSTTVSLDFTSHAYSAAKSYQVKITLTDTPPGAMGVTGSVVPSPATIVVTNLILPTAPTIVAPGQSAVVPVSFAAGSSNAGVNLTTSCSVSPAGGPVCSVSPTTVMLQTDGTGSAVVTVTANGSSAAPLVPRSNEWPGLPLTLLIALLGLALVFLSRYFPGSSTRKQPRWGLALLLLTSAIMLAMGACTNVQRSTIGCTNCTAAGSYMVTFNAKSIAPPLQINGVFTVMVTH